MYTRVQCTCIRVYTRVQFTCITVFTRVQCTCMTVYRRVQWTFTAVNTVYSLQCRKSIMYTEFSSPSTANKRVQCKKHFYTKFSVHRTKCTQCILYPGLCQRKKETIFPLHLLQNSWVCSSVYNFSLKCTEHNEQSTMISVK